MSDVSDIDDRIAEAALEVDSIATDGTQVKNRTLADLIAAREHAARAAAATKNHLGIHFRKMIPVD